MFGKNIASSEIRTCDPVDSLQLIINNKLWILAMGNLSTYKVQMHTLICNLVVRIPVFLSVYQAMICYIYIYIYISIYIYIYIYLYIYLYIYC